MVNEMKRVAGAPADVSGRTPREQRSYALLEQLGVMFDRVDHPAADDMIACARVGEVLGAPLCKNLFLCNRQKTKFYLLAMPGEKPFKTKELSGQLDIARLSFAGPEEMARLLDVTPGSVSVLGLMQDTQQSVQLLLDEDLRQEPWFGCHPCQNTSSLRMKTEDLLQIVLPALHHDPIWVTLRGED